MKFIFTLIMGLGLATVAFAQDTITIASGPDNAGLLETTINNDVDAGGNRLHPNRVYKLSTGIHFQLSAINVDNPDGTLTIVGETGGKKPVIVPVATNDVGVGVNLVNGSLSLHNLHYQAKNDIGGFTQDNESQWELVGLDRKLTVEDCLMEFTNFQLFMANGVTDGLIIEMRNNYFRDLFWDQQWWASRVFQAKVPIDTLIFENNTVTGSGMALLQQEALCMYALINHNSFINNHAYVILNNYYYEAYFTNNLFYNSQTKGEDFTVIALEPDGIPTDIIGIDTINTSILVQPEVLADENTLAAPFNDIGNYKFYAANNIYYNQPELNPYYSGAYNDLYDAPVSYLSWFGPGPHKVEVPTPFKNSRAEAMDADWNNIVYENNILDQDPGLNTVAISEADAEQHAIWNRRLYEVPDETRTPDMSGWYFGDNDPTTIPGIETEDGDGITKFSDLIEDLSISNEFKSSIDGHTIGALHWTSEIESFNSAASLASIIDAYNRASSGGNPGLQDTIEIASGPDNAGLLETTINNDVDAEGNRLHPNRVYKLLKGIHFQLSAINIDNPDGTLTIVGETGGKKPVIVPIASNDIGVGVNLVNGSLSLHNLHYQAKNDIGGFTQDNESQWELVGLDRKLTVEDCLMEFTNFQLFMANGVTDGLIIEMRNNYFRDLFWDQQWWASRVFQAKVPIDTLIFENNTVTGSGMALLQQEALCMYALINHNSFINNHAYVILNNYYYEAYFTNNLFYNSQTKGEDFTVIALEPDGIPTDIIGIDTINTSILVQPEVLADENTLAAPFNDIGNYKFYASNNIYYNQPELNPYYSGAYNDLYDAPVSYLSWFGPGPHKVEVPTPFKNSRAEAMDADWNNIVYENNILDQDPGLNTVAISEADAEQHAIWNRRLYEVPDETRTPDMSGWYFGDNDPTTIPGIETEDGDGITKFSDLIEDLSISNEFKSSIDGHTIGALHWTSEIESYDPAASLASILSGYEQATMATSVREQPDLFVDAAKNFPNPFHETTVINFELKERTKVRLTIHDMSGKLLTVLHDGMLSKGQHNINWNASSVASGIYLFVFEAGNFKTSHKMVVTK